MLYGWWLCKKKILRIDLSSEKKKIFRKRFQYFHFNLESLYNIDLKLS